MENNTKFVFSKENISLGKITFLIENEAESGINKIARRVIDDIELVFEKRVKEVSKTSELGDFCIIAGNVKNSPIITKLEKEGVIDLKNIKNKREVYLFNVKKLTSKDKELNGKCALIIAGSDKRGTIYGLFKLSELLGVSPFVDWLSLLPKKQSKIELSEQVNITPEEPSVKYRGFFINDEWPAFGNWCNHNFGGFNAKAYEHVFELLLRLRGNYMWPAMWTSIFPDDGPGLASAELADELGVVMGMSHHEPCLRQGEEYKYLRGPKSIYGDAWDFRKNREGITKFWEDGLKRGGHLENVITVGMRGEFDSAIMGEHATLKDNIDLLRDVLKTQNKLIKKYVNRDLKKVPRMLALYKEVEPFFYGDSKTKGLMDDKELDGVTLMLCDDNFGNLRTLPTEHMRKHEGGYGMYYHFDYHGAPISYEWVNSSYLPKVWEQMTTAYEFGIRDLWIVNVGDIFTTEFPLSYFMDMAYDFDRWGTSNMNSPKEYTEKFIEDNFKDRLSKSVKNQMYEVLYGYTAIAHNRRPEAMNEGIYDTLNYEETGKLLDEIDRLNDVAIKLADNVDESDKFPVYELFEYPATANLNVQKLWLLTGLNKEYVKQQRTSAGKYEAMVEECLKRDKEITDRLHEIQGGKWYGMGMSEHIGFKYWNEEECQYPVLSHFEPGNKKRLIVSVVGTCQHTEGGYWTRKKLIVGDFCNPSCNEAYIELSTAGKESVNYTIECDCDAVKLSSNGGICKFGEDIRIKLSLDRKKLKSKDAFATITVKGENDDITTVVVPVPVINVSKYAQGTFIWCGAEDDFGCEYHPYRYIMMNAEDYMEKSDTKAGTFTVIEDAGRVTSAIKVMPPLLNTISKRSAPSVSYDFELPEKGTYVAKLFFSPTNPAFNDQKLLYGISVNKAAMNEYNEVEDGYRVGDHSVPWEKGVLDNIRYNEVEFAGKKGINVLKFAALSPQVVLERIMIYKKGDEPAYSYLGPDETYRV